MRFYSAFASLLFAATLPLSAVAATNSPAANTSTKQPVRISTGVTAPVLVKSVPVAFSDFHDTLATSSSTTFQVKLTVDANGKTSNIVVLRSGAPFDNREVIEALSKFEFKPAMLDEMPVASSMRMNLVVTR